MKIRTHISMTMDGFVADAAGLPAWDYLPTFTGSGHGYPEFMAGIGAIAMGGTSFTQGFKDWLPSWPWPGKPVFVLTSKPIPADAPEGVVAVSSAGDLVAQARAADVEGDVQLLGGPTAIAAVLAADGLDELGVVVLPLLLGSGIPLFAGRALPFSQERWTASQATSGDRPSRSLYELLRQEAFPDGAVHLVYAPPE